MVPDSYFSVLHLCGVYVLSCCDGQYSILKLESLAGNIVTTEQNTSVTWDVLGIKETHKTQAPPDLGNGRICEKVSQRRRHWSDRQITTPSADRVT